jgi:hypothetical protein
MPEAWVRAVPATLAELAAFFAEVAARRTAAAIRVDALLAWVAADVREPAAWTLEVPTLA